MWDEKALKLTGNKIKHIELSLRRNPETPAPKDAASEEAEDRAFNAGGSGSGGREAVQKERGWRGVGGRRGRE
jgi:hypothetical protein